MERTRPVRRKKQVRKRRGKLLRYLLAAAAVFAAANIFFEISDIQVEGNMVYSSTEIVEASGLQTGRSALLTGGPLVGLRVRRALPGITGAVLKLRLPDTLVISVEETPAVAVLETPAGYILLSSECKVVNGFAGDEAALLHVKGITPDSADVGKALGVSDAESAKLSYLQELFTRLESEGLLPDVADVDVSNVSDLHFRYLGRFTVRLGDQDSLSSKLNLLRRIADTLGAGDSGTLDLSAKQEGHFIPD